jgi:hypothetical protein
MTKTQTPAGYDRDSYDRGWRASQRATGSFTLEHADARGEPGAWYDGYLDHAAGRGKWHTPNCPAHHNGPGGCGEA